MVNVHPFIWIGGDVGEAVSFYRRAFPGVKVTDEAKVPQDDGSELYTTATVHLPGMDLTVFNAGPFQELNQAVSMFITCEDQSDVDRLWDLFCDGGTPSQCGWVTDRFGVTWQVVPSALGRLMSDPDPVRAGRVRDAMMKMVKLDAAALQAAYDGK
jgi:predicted 3-demethylubiquinone-9 3-methyltransferase (glyoxalase superfamily)